MSGDETPLVHHEDELNQAAPPEAVGVLNVQLTSVALGPDYPATAVSAEIGRMAIAAARVDEEYALLLSALHAGRRTDWDFEKLRRGSSRWLRDTSLDRVEELFEEELLEHARDTVQAAYMALDHRHVAMHSVWTLTGPDAMTPVPDLVAALESPDPDATLAALVGRDLDSEGWQTMHPRTGAAGPGSLAELRRIRGELEHAGTASQGCASVSEALSTSESPPVPAGSSALTSTSLRPHDLDQAPPLHGVPVMGSSCGADPPAVKRRGGSPHHIVGELDRREPASLDAFTVHRGVRHRRRDASRVPATAGGSELQEVRMQQSEDAVGSRSKMSRRMSSSMSEVCATAPWPVTRHPARRWAAGTMRTACRGEHSWTAIPRLEASEPMRAYGRAEG